MYCNNCGQKIDSDSIFCQFCGYKLQTDHSSQQSNEFSKKDSGNSEMSGSADILWSKFVEVFNAKSDESIKHKFLSSDYIWLLIERLSTSSFEEFMETKRKEFNPQPYKVIEALKYNYISAVVAGYNLWIAEALLKDLNLRNINHFSHDDFIKDFQSYDMQNIMKNISSDMQHCMSTFIQHRFNTLLDKNPSLKEISNSTIEELKESLIYQVFNGYIAGEIEAKYRN